DCSGRSEEELYSKLDRASSILALAVQIEVDSRILDDVARNRAARDEADRRIRMVEGIERVHAQSKRELLLDPEILEDPEVHVVEQRPGLDVARHGAVRSAEYLGRARSVYDVPDRVL